MRAALVLLFALACMDYLARGSNSIPFLAVYIGVGLWHDVAWFFYRI